MPEEQTEPVQEPADAAGRWYTDLPEATSARRRPTHDTTTVAALNARPRAAKRAGPHVVQAWPCWWRDKESLLCLDTDGFVRLIADGRLAAHDLAHVTQVVVEPLEDSLEIAFYSKQHTVRLEDDTEAFAVVTMVTDAQNRYEMETAGPRPLALATDERIVRGCLFLTGTGLELRVGDPYDLVFREEHLEIVLSPVADDSNPLVTKGWDELDVVRLEGPGRVESGGGFIGGGFGVKAAAEGMAIAAVLNSLTKRVKVESILVLGGPGWEAFFLHSHRTPVELRQHLSPVFVRLRDGNSAAPTASLPTEATAGVDPVAQLERLAALHQQGVLTEQEFAEAKRKILGT